MRKNFSGQISVQPQEQKTAAGAYAGKGIKTCLLKLSPSSDWGRNKNLSFRGSPRRKEQNIYFRGDSKKQKLFFKVLSEKNRTFFSKTFPEERNKNPSFLWSLSGKKQKLLSLIFCVKKHYFFNVASIERKKKQIMIFSM